MIVRVQLITGDSRVGLYVRHDETHLYINDGRVRKIQFIMIADVSEYVKIESCLEGK